MTAWRRTINAVDFKKGFEDIRYTWEDDSPVSPRTLPGYTFDPTTLDVPSSETEEEKDEEENQIEIQAKSAEEETKKYSPRTRDKKCSNTFDKSNLMCIYIIYLCEFFFFFHFNVFV